MTKNERVRKVRNELDLTCEAFGDRLGVSKVSISNLENGVNNLSPRMAKSICREYNVNPYWLETGNGEMFVEPSYDDMDFSEEMLKPENKMFLELFKACKKTFTQEDWDDIERIIEKSYQIVQELKNGNKEESQE